MGQVKRVLTLLLFSLVCVLALLSGCSNGYRIQRNLLTAPPSYYQVPSGGEGSPPPALEGGIDGPPSVDP
ncbi:hypothetical protein KP509_18G068900 [Ceratopteris richardii]|uniref:Lipoprotein n=1 Tax=Ceratopteris richardii TaxID=49495 RepID=A0A8T2SUC3_CERRI|nr:hypothetical protein KP509_18G068900 [Ceratopteris richardii]